MRVVPTLPCLTTGDTMGAMSRTIATSVGTRALLRDATDIVLVDELDEIRYPLARRANGADPDFVGRIRRDSSSENGHRLWIAAGGLRKRGALEAMRMVDQAQAR